MVLTGAGRAFCAGQDLAEHAATLDDDPATAFATIEEHYTPIVNVLTTMPKPVLAAINGTCVGAGLGLALACDLRIAAAGARLATAFTAIGLTCDSGLSATLVRAVGAARASELILLGEPFTVEQAAEWGLVSQVVDRRRACRRPPPSSAAGSPPDQPWPTPPRSWPSPPPSHRPSPTCWPPKPTAQARLGQSRDHGDAVAAFLAKRPPEFHGR